MAWDAFVRSGLAGVSRMNLYHYSPEAGDALTRHRSASATKRAPRPAAVAERSPSAIRVVVASGPDAGRTLSVDRSVFTVGSGNMADLRLTDPKVEAVHLKLSIDPAGVRLRDLATREGTWIGSLRVMEAVLTHSTTIRCGDTSLAVDIGDAASKAVSTSARFGAAVAESTSMRQLFATLERASTEEITVLLCGESGVGKDVLANAIHQHSARSSGPFVTVDCGAISPALIESHLFGHERGAFTGAERSVDGAFVQADGGTLFLDEVGELPLELQPKLLRVLENGEISPVGGKPRRVNARVVAATNRNLSDAANFRRDLYYRLAVLRVDVPSLRQRREDILPLARILLQRIPGHDQTSLPFTLEARLLAHSWPGNVRELKNVIQRFIVMGADAPDLFGDDTAASTESLSDLSLLPYREARARAIERFEQAYVPSVLARSGNVVVQAAKNAGVERETFHRMIVRVRDSSK